MGITDSYMEKSSGTYLYTFAKSAMNIKTSIKGAMSGEKVYCRKLLFTSVLITWGSIVSSFNAAASDMITGIISFKGTCHACMSHMKTNL